MLRPVRSTRICLATPWSACRGLARRLAAVVCLAPAACHVGAPRPFAPPVPAVVADNQQAGDPHAGRFPYADAVAGLPEGPTLRAVIDTEAGAIHCRLDPSSAPIAVASFVGLARGLRPFQSAPDGPWERAPFFDGLPFHRAVEAQFVQTGRRGERESPGFRLQDEMSSGHTFDRAGLLALANAGTPHTGAAQFFITTEPLPHLDGKHTIFGACDDEDVVRELERQVLAGQAPRIRTVTITRGS